MTLARLLSLVAIVTPITFLPVRATPPDRPLLFPNPVHSLSGVMQDAAVADIDEDGFPDCVGTIRHSNLGSSYAVVSLHGHGNGLFDPIQEIPLPSATQIFVLRLDGDAHVDAVVRNNGMVSVLKGSGDGTFLAPAAIPGLSLAVDFVVADLNGDSRPDIATLMTMTPDASRIRYVLQQPDGSFGPTIDRDLGYSAVELATADMNQDGFADLLVGSGGTTLYSGEYGFRLYYGPGFGPGSPVVGSSRATYIVTGDFNLDGRTDVVTLGLGATQLEIATYLGIGPGAPVHTGQNREADFPSAIAVGDFDRDHIPDIVIRGGAAEIYRGVGDGSFEAARQVRGNQSGGVVVANINDDDWLDLLAWRDTVDRYMTVFLGRSDGSFGQRTLWTPPTGGLLARDIDGDGLTDILTAGTQISVRLRSSSGGFEDAIQFPGVPNPLASTLLDSNHDGDLDVAVGGYSTASVAAGSGNGGFGPPVTTSGGDVHTAIVPLDYDQDGDDDVALSCDGTICFQDALPNGVFGPSWRYQVNGVVGRMIGVDLNQDGRTDLAAATKPGGQPYQLVTVLSHGDATFETAGSYALPGSVVLASADFDEDGKADIVTAHLPGGFEIYRGLGGGQLAAPVSWSTIPLSTSPDPGLVEVLTADFDLDGHQDIAILHQVLEIALGDGLGGFSRRQVFAVPRQDWTVTPAFVAFEVNGDGDPDLAMRTNTGDVDLVLSDSGPLISQPPVAAAGLDQVVECGAQVALDAGASVDPDSTPGTQNAIAGYEWFEHFGQPSQVLLGSGPSLSTTLALGAHVVTLRVTDWSGRSSTDDLNVTVQDTTPPVIVGSLDVPTLWPPNHRMVAITAIVSASDLCGPSTLMLDAVGSSEPDDAPGLEDGITAGDVQGASPGTPDASFSLRAERSALGTGRTYTVTYRAQDSQGNTGFLPMSIVVPHDVGGVSEPLTIRLRETAAGTLVEWDAVPGARFYNAVIGDLDSLRALPLGDPMFCLASTVLGRDTTGYEIDFDPEVGKAFVVLVEYDDGQPSGYGTATAVYDRTPVAPSSLCP